MDREVQNEKGEGGDASPGIDRLIEVSGILKPVPTVEESGKGTRVAPVTEDVAHEAVWFGIQHILGTQL